MKFGVDKSGKTEYSIIPKTYIEDIKKTAGDFENNNQIIDEEQATKFKLNNNIKEKISKDLKFPPTLKFSTLMLCKAPTGDTTQFGTPQNRKRNEEENGNKNPKRGCVSSKGQS